MIIEARRCVYFKPMWLISQKKNQDYFLNLWPKNKQNDYVNGTILTALLTGSQYKDKSVLIMNGDSFTFMMGTLSWPGLNSARLHSVIILDKEAQVPELWSKACSRTEKEQWLMWVLGLPWPSHTLCLRPETQPALWFGPCLWARRLHKTHLFGSRLYLPQRSDCQTTNEPQSFCSGSGSPSCLNR